MKITINGYDGNPYSKLMKAIDKNTNDEIKHFTIILVGGYFYGSTANGLYVSTDDKLLELQEA